MLALIVALIKVLMMTCLLNVMNINAQTAYVDDTKTFTVAESFCQNVGSKFHLISIHNQDDENYYFNEMLPTDMNTCNNQFWIGLKWSNTNTVWTWTDESNFDYHASFQTQSEV